VIAKLRRMKSAANPRKWIIYSGDVLVTTMSALCLLAYRTDGRAPAECAASQPDR
jgi:hypothetical protein